MFYDASDGTIGGVFYISGNYVVSVQASNNSFFRNCMPFSFSPALFAVITFTILNINYATGIH